MPVVSQIPTQEETDLNIPPVLQQPCSCNSPVSSFVISDSFQRQLQDHRLKCCAFHIKRMGCETTAWTFL